MMCENAPPNKRKRDVVEDDDGRIVMTVSTANTSETPSSGSLFSRLKALHPEVTAIASSSLTVPAFVDRTEAVFLEDERGNEKMVPSKGSLLENSELKSTDTRENATIIDKSSQGETSAATEVKSDNVDERRADAVASVAATSRSSIAQKLRGHIVAKIVKSKTHFAPMQPVRTQLKSYEPIKVLSLFPTKDNDDMNGGEQPSTTTCTSCLELSAKIEALETHAASQQKRIEQLQAIAKEKEDAYSELRNDLEKVSRKLKKRKKQVKELDNEQKKELDALRDKYKDAMSEIERQRKEIRKLRDNNSSSLSREIELHQRDVLNVRLKMNEMQETIYKQEETIATYSELLKKLGYKLSGTNNL